MSSTFTFQVTTQVQVTVDRVEGKFASRDEIQEALQDAFLDAAAGIVDAAHEAALDGLGADGASVYEVSSTETLGTDAFVFTA